MNAAFIAMLVLTGIPTPIPSDPTALVAQLGSTRFVERQAAEQALRELGRQALPALRVAETNADPEISTRASLILRRIEGGLLVEPTMITLDFASINLADAIKTINRQSDIQLKLTPDLPPLWAQRQISVRTPQPLPFWQALDTLCRVGSLHYVFGAQANVDQGELSVALYDGFGSPQGIFDDRGPFRIQLASLHYQSEIHLSHRGGDERLLAHGGSMPSANGPGHDVTSKQFFLQLLVGAEPRLVIAPAGPVQVIEAIDERGQSLMLPTRGDTVQRDSGYLGFNPSPLVHLRLDLARPEGQEGRIKRVRGSIPLHVSTRKPNPIEISLAEGSGKVIQQSGISLRVGEMHLDLPDQPSTLELTIKNRTPVVEPVEGDEEDHLRAITSPQQIEILDAVGQAILWFPSSSVYNGEEAKLTLTLLDRGGPVHPATIRYHDVIRDRVEVAFEFHDLPIP